MPSRMRLQISSSLKQAVEDLTVRRALDEASQAFAVDLPEGPASSTPDLDARVLLSAATGWSWAQLLANPKAVLESSVVSVWASYVQRRQHGEPVAYILGHKEFWGLEFFVGPEVLIPRPDTEILVETALKFLKTAKEQLCFKEPLRVLDVCTGSGCVAVALAYETQRLGLNCEIAATDVSPLAVQTALKNVERWVPGRVRVTQADLTAGQEGPWDLIVSNPPYLTSEETAQRLGPGQWKEPALALDGGPDGLALLRRLIEETLPKLASGGCLVLEAGSTQMTELTEFLTNKGLKVQVFPDLAGLPRVLLAELP